MTKQTHTPELEPFCGSWIVVSRSTGCAVLETFSRKVAEAVNVDKYEVMSAYQYLVRFNGTVDRGVRT